MRLERTPLFEDVWLVDGVRPRQALFVRAGRLEAPELATTKRRAFEAPFEGERAYARYVVDKLRNG